MGETIVVAIGGNALIKKGQKGTIYEQFANSRETCSHLLKIIKEGYRMVLTHGNGPQVGEQLLRNELARDKIPPNPLGICGSDTQGTMGYMLQQTMGNTLRLAGINMPVVTVITQVLVDKDHPSFRTPTKPIGMFYTKEEAMERAKRDGWTVKEDAGRGWRRLVESPIPLEIIEIDIIKCLVDHGILVIACGGGGLPVIRLDDGRLDGVEMVVDKDRASAILATQLGVKRFMILTAVDRVALNYGKPDQVFLDEMTVDEAKRYLADGQFPPGSMGPKIESAVQFLEHGGEEVIITDIHLADRALKGEAGTRIHR